jgi:hypothetical protein
MHGHMRVKYRANSSLLRVQHKTGIIYLFARSNLKLHVWKFTLKFQTTRCIQIVNKSPDIFDWYSLHIEMYTNCPLLMHSVQKTRRKSEMWSKSSNYRRRYNMEFRRQIHAPAVLFPIKQHELHTGLYFVLTVARTKRYSLFGAT